MRCQQSKLIQSISVATNGIMWMNASSKCQGWCGVSKTNVFDLFHGSSTEMPVKQNIYDIPSPIRANLHRILRRLHTMSCQNHMINSSSCSTNELPCKILGHLALRLRKICPNVN
mmetsp:Transcript_126578/g.229866  ORF Transcript_126578/g.229866 Transcript_126578/m.229866 type:complete len:115 (-) Transcript_126578:398-742(-)